MAEKSNKPTNVWGKPVPMKLFAAWEVDRTPPNCIPRLCTLNLTRLILLKPVGDEMSSVILAVKMQSSKRTLRSNEIMVPNNGLLDTELDLTFSLQYPHFLKRSGNNLQIMIQRRKRYKNRAMLGFKTLAGGVINMAEVLQRPMDMDLDLLSSKEKNDVIARASVFALSSQPVDHEEADHQKLSRGIQRVEVDNFSDEEEEYTSNEEGCDSEPAAEEATLHVDETISHHSRKALDPKIYQHGEERPDPAERNIKQKFIALLKKFRIPEAEVSDSEQYQEELEQELISENPQEFEDLMDELESMTDSGPDVDDISISSTPKPSLRPFFSSGTLTALDKVIIPPINDDVYRRSEDNQESGTDQDNTDTSQTASSPPKSLIVEEKKTQPTEKEKKRLFARDKNIVSTKDKRSLNVKEKSLSEKSASKDSECSPQKTVMEQLARIFPLDDSIPDHIFLISANEAIGNFLAAHLLDRAMNIVSILSFADLRAFFSCLLNKIQKFCNCNSRAPQTIKIGIVGQDGFVNSVLRSYVEHFSSKPLEWQSYVNFLIVPIAPSDIALCMANVDAVYGGGFADCSWKDLLEHCNESTSTPKVHEVIERLIGYLKNINVIWRMPIAEAMVTYKEKSSEDESSQIFIPFLIDVKVGMESIGQAASVDSEDQASGLMLNVPGSSPPAASEKTPRENITPPSSPSISVSLLGSNTVPSGPVPPFAGETMDLQLDCWMVPAKCEGGKRNETSKMSLKSTFRTVHVCTRVMNQAETSSSLTLSYITKEKKQKIMRLGKKKEKEKEPENRCQSIDNIHRLICSCRALQSPLKVTIDGVEWNGVKFFQLTAQWQTHVKHFPVALFSMMDYLP